MKIKDVNDMFQLCLNRIHETQHFLFRDIGEDRAGELAHIILDLEDVMMRKAIAKFEEQLKDKDFRTCAIKQLLTIKERL